MAEFLNAERAKACKSCRSRQELSNQIAIQTSIYSEYLLAKFGVDTAENMPLKVCLKLGKIRKNIVEGSAAWAAWQRQCAHLLTKARDLEDSGGRAGCECRPTGHRELA